MTASSAKEQFLGKDYFLEDPGSTPRPACWASREAWIVLFKLELVPYGYTFVGKGIRSPHPWPCGHETRLLNHESYMYARLDRLQGEAVPVHLGLVQLARDPPRYAHRLRPSHPSFTPQTQAGCRDVG
ncbi:hypothetical protein BGZ61DRAFT_466168 [Ilyonectria robusta]|uniref:uncharacterized protein n=1 Tax=Ilyonectria robusta TaxID=1079257 RepID=UPI001E8D0984|nr:uncharacterized protein BGZ61DRAFT_466168 [Ilyonectria robusta]KAH8656784.1 hypothetical protein BGZ61DRAFT_466168 [Ilyonectria robusta]